MHPIGYALPPSVAYTPDKLYAARVGSAVCLTSPPRRFRGQAPTAPLIQRLLLFQLAGKARD